VGDWSAAHDASRFFGRHPHPHNHRGGKG
jgi:hypothetical protein